MTQQFKLSSIIDDAQLRQNRVSKTIPCLLLSSLLVIGGCANKDVIVSKDNSAEYKSARLLPPLIKPTEEQPVAANEAPQLSTTTVSNSVQSEPSQDTERSVEPVANSSSSESAVLKTTNTQKLDPGILTEGDSVKLILNSAFDGAWSYLTSQLAGSEVTVFSRNKSAGRIAIGCAEIRNDTPTLNKSKWSIFNRKAKRSDEYCSLQVVERKSTSVVSVLNREGQEIAGDDARLVFNRLLK